MQQLTNVGLFGAIAFLSPQLLKNESQPPD